MMQQYVGWLLQEIQSTPHTQQSLNTIFFGGGTPSLLEPRQVQTILQSLSQQFGIDPHAEISMEMDPGTFTRSHLEGYLAAGVNRISLGAQAFQDELLQSCGRTHRVVDIYAAFELLRRSGCTNISLDLMSGLPQQTLQDWEESLSKAIALAPEHISAYDLVVEPGTVFGKRYEPGDYPLPNDELTAQLYRQASARLSNAGYEHYEISNYAHPGFRCQHNQVYWRNESYYGFGMGAASYLRHQRFSRPRTRAAYREWLDGYISSDGQIAEPYTSESDRLFETFMLGLRQTDGVNLEKLKIHFGETVIDGLIQALDPFLEKGWVGWSNSTQVRLTDPEGFLFSNQVLVALWEAIELTTIDF